MEIDQVPNGNGSTTAPTSETTASSVAMVVASNTTAAASSKLSHLTESLKLEHQFLRVPFEHFKKTIRANHRTVEKEVSSVISTVADVANSNEISKDDVILSLTSLVSRLQGIKRKVKDSHP